MRAGIVGFTAAGMSVEELGQALTARGIELAASGSCVRLFANLNTTHQDADAVAAIVRQVVTGAEA
jgi:hypothetical protein